MKETEEITAQTKGVKREKIKICGCGKFGTLDECLANIKEELLKKQENFFKNSNRELVGDVKYSFSRKANRFILHYKYKELGKVTVRYHEKKPINLMNGEKVRVGELEEGLFINEKSGLQGEIIKYEVDPKATDMFFITIDCGA